MAEYKETLRRLALNDETFVAAVLGMGRNTVEDSTLDEKTHALARLSASLAIDAASSSYQSNVELGAGRRRDGRRDRRVPDRGGAHHRAGPRRVRRARARPGPRLRRRRSARDTRRIARVTPIRAP